MMIEREGPALECRDRFHLRADGPDQEIDKRFCICKSIYMHTIRFAAGVIDDLRQISAYYRRQIFTAIDTHLTHNATTPSRRRKLLVNLIPPWEAVPPIWELRVGAYRVFYDVSEADRIISVRAIRHKPMDQRTEEIL